MKFTSAFVGDMSGSVGGLTASRAKGGVDYFRFRATPTNPQTTRQTAVRSALGLLASNWKSVLTQSERDSWIAEAGGTEQSGIDLYVGFNTPRLQALMASVAEFTGGVASQPGAITIGSFAAGAYNIAFDNTALWANTDGAGLILYASQPRTPSRPSNRRERFLGVVLGNSTTAPTSPATIASPWGNSANVGDTLVVRAVVTNPNGLDTRLTLPSLVVT